MATHFSILAGITPLTEEPGGLQPKRSQLHMSEPLNTHRRKAETMRVDEAIQIQCTEQGAGQELTVKRCFCSQSSRKKIRGC